MKLSLIFLTMVVLSAALISCRSENDLESAEVEQGRDIRKSEERLEQPITPTDVKATTDISPPKKKLLLKLEDPSIILSNKPIMSQLGPRVLEDTRKSDANSGDGLSLDDHLKKLQIGYLEEEHAAIIGYSFARKSDPARAADARSEITTPLEWREELHR